MDIGVGGLIQILLDLLPEKVQKFLIQNNQSI